MKILITGYKGFIGSELVDHYKDKHEVVVIGRDIIDLCDSDALNCFMNIHNNFDIVFHCASVGGRSDIKDTSDIFYNNILMFENLIKHRDKFNTFIIFGSGAEFDKRRDIKNVYEDEIGMSIPTDYYGLSKYVINQRLKSMQGKYNKYFNLILFAVFGEHEEENRFIKTAIRCLKNNETLYIQNKYMDFFFIKDVLKVCDKVLEGKLDYVSGRAWYNTINLVYPMKYKLSEIVTMIDVNLKYEINGDGLSYTGNDSRLSKLNLNLIGLQEGINETKRKLLK